MIDIQTIAVSIITPVTIATGTILLKSMKDTAKWRGEYEANKVKPQEALDAHASQDLVMFQQVIDRIEQSENHIIDVILKK